MALKKEILPIIPVRGFVIFPKTVFHFDVARQKSIAAVEKAIISNGLIFLAAQKDDTVEEPRAEDIHSFGTVAKIKQLVKLPDGALRILTEGVERGTLSSDFFADGLYEGEITYRKSSVRNLSEEEYSAFAHQIHLLIDDYASLNPKLLSESFFKTLPTQNPAEFSDAVASRLVRSNKDRQTLLEITSVKKRLLKLIDIMTKELKILDVETIIASKVKQQMDEHNNEYYLREQLKAIKSELGEDRFDDAYDLRCRIESIPLPEELYEKALRELRSLETLPPTSPESNISRNYLELVCSLPWEVFTDENTDLQHARAVLERDHYGMEKVKERILEQLAVISRTKNPSGSILCLLGAPGVGKTSVAKSVAKATGRNYVRISLGGMKDESEIRGHRKTYVGAMPGRIVNALRTAKSSNPLILLDEIDKIGADYKGDPASALLEILDPEQNSSFRDNYLEAGIDLSRVLFIATANDLSTVPAPLLDRLEVIELSSYTAEEKLHIAKQHLVEKQLAKHALDKKQLKISDKAIKDIIFFYTRESGVRNLEREIASLCRKAVLALENGEKSLSITEKNLSVYLGKRKYTEDIRFDKDKCGIVNGLAWTQTGGEVLQCEAVCPPGSGKVQITGQLGDVMKESVLTALGFIRTVSDILGIEKDFYKTRDIHVHFPEGAVPKDGPSAGITVATALASALSSSPAACDFSMTGEISLLGRVLPIGGLKEKILASYRYGIKNIVIPKENIKDLADIPENILRDISVFPCEDCMQVLSLVLSKPFGKNVYPAPPLLQYTKERNSFYEYS